jgi:hypothetical protein
MVQEVIEEAIVTFVKNVSRMIGTGIRWIWLGRKQNFDQILSSKWNNRIGIIVICLIIVWIIYSKNQF